MFTATRARAPFVRSSLVALFVAALAAIGTAQDPIGEPAAAVSIEVELQVDFGDGKPPRTRTVSVPRGSDVVATTRAAHVVVQDWLCCSPDDVWAIDGVGPDPRLDRYWFWTLDGKGGPNAPAKHVLSGGERIGWRYGAGKLSHDQRIRIVSLLPAATSIVRAIGGERSLVGLSEMCLPPDGESLPRVTRSDVDSRNWSMSRIDAEVRRASQTSTSLYHLDEAQIRELRPTVVFSQGLCPVCAVAPEQAAAGLPDDRDAKAELVILSPHSLADIANDIRKVGAAIGRANAARVAARAFERRIEALRTLPPMTERPRVAVLEWFDPLWASGEWIAELVDAAGGTPALVDASAASRAIEWRDLVAADPDVIVLAACSMSIERTERELAALTSRPEWAQLRAVKRGDVFVMDGERQFSTPGPDVAAGGEALARLLRDRAAEPAGA